VRAIATEFRDRRQREERKHRLNREISAPEIRLMGPDNEALGIVPLQEALRAAGELDVDLVEIAATASPPVCRLMDYGKFKYQEQKKAAEAKAKQAVVEIKEVKFRPGTDDGDYNIKLRNIRRFLGEGDKCKITLRFRGREITHQQLGLDLLNRLRDDLADSIQVEQFPKLEGRQMVMMIAPARKKPGAGKPAEAGAPEKIQGNTKACLGHKVLQTGQWAQA
jgi:translation initiation factor IF-3